jgi:hypothetical protein
VCKIQACSDLLIERETTDYELEKVPVPNQCCPSIVRIACKEGDTVYKVHASSSSFTMLYFNAVLNTVVTPQLLIVCDSHSILKELHNVVCYCCPEM